MPGVLEGIRVLDFGRFIAGPYCAALLADLGADVVRIERCKGGDDRYLMPATDGGEGAMFLQSARSKQSLTLEMGTPQGREVMRRLIAGADIVIANLSPGALKYFGLDYESLKQIKPDIILTTVSAYGSEGPLKDSVGFDGIGQAVSGAIYLSGVPGQPYRSASSYVDFSTALSCAFGTLAALMARQKTGKGTHVQASLAGTAINIMNPIMIEQFTGTNLREPTGNRSPIAGPSDIFAASDGWFIMQCIGQTMFKRWVKLVGRPELLDDPRYADDILRGRNGEELSRIMSEWCAGRTREECLSILAAENIAAGPVLSPGELVGGALGLFDAFTQHADYPGTRAGIPLARPPVEVPSATSGKISPPPQLGAHTTEVLARYGFGAEEIETLRREGIV